MDEEWMPSNQKELLTELEKEWKALITLAENLTDAQISKPDSGGWTPKDNLAHLTEWMNILLGYHIEKLPSHEVIGGVSAEKVADWDIDVINPLLFERNKDRSREDVMNSLKQIYERVFAKLKSMPFEDLLKPRHPDDPEKRPLLLWVLGNTTRHFNEHRETIERGFK